MIFEEGEALEDDEETSKQEDRTSVASVRDSEFEDKADHQPP